MSQRPARKKPAAAPLCRRPAKRLKCEDIVSDAIDDETEWTYDRLWDDPDISERWHDRNVYFWKKQADNLRGMTGGGVSQRDLAFSRSTLESFFEKDMTMGKVKGRPFDRVLDCGAGIGRVTEAVLRHFSSHVDLVEFVKKHLQKAKQKLPQSAKTGCTYAFHNSSMQNFQIESANYDLIWCQWLLMYLTDADALDFLKRARIGLGSLGVIVVKENVSTSEKATYFDDADGELWEPGEVGSPVSCVRTALHYEDLFDRAGLQITREKHQTDLGPGCMEMQLWVLEPAERAASNRRFLPTDS